MYIKTAVISGFNTHVYVCVCRRVMVRRLSTILVVYMGNIGRDESSDNCQGVGGVMMSCMGLSLRACTLAKAPENTSGRVESDTAEPTCSVNE